jgi:hypothetical protein
MATERTINHLVNCPRLGYGQKPLEQCRKCPLFDGIENDRVVCDYPKKVE